MIIKKERKWNGSDYEERTVISMTDSPDDGSVFNTIVKHEKYDELMDLAEKISQLNILWYEADEGKLGAREKHDELELEIKDLYNALMPGSDWDRAGGYEESFWDVVNMATGNTD